MALRISTPSSPHGSTKPLSSSSLCNVSLAFTRLKAKRSPSLTVPDGAVECTSADTFDFLLQPRDNAGPLNGVFVEDGKPKKTGKEEETKVKAIQQRLSQKGIAAFHDSDVSFAVTTPYAKGNEDKAYELLSLVAESEKGIIHPYDINVKMLGAINREGVTCWLDSLLFAMFARLGSFQTMLNQKFEDQRRKRLATLLRLWINTLRAGKLITVDITKQIQLQLADCGWKGAAELCQHDASEAFTFITEALSLPLLTLKMDIYHTGKEDQKDDHKFINERLLELGIPDETQDCHSVTLEDCLEMYFNNKIEVKRYLDALERRNTLSSVRSRASLDSVKAYSSHIEIAEVDNSQMPSPMPQSAPPLPSQNAARPSSHRHRAPSIIQEHYVDEKRGLLGSDSDSRHARLRKEVMMPAWQFFRLIPWYTDKQPVNDSQVAAHFASTHPILGICLKRYGMLPNGTAYKKRTHVDIPLEIGLPHFISGEDDDDMSEDTSSFGNFKLSLQSFVCHQGMSVDTGHYVSFTRTPNPTQQGQDQWMRLDDLAKERVVGVNIEEQMKRESPYLLFYQVMPIEEAPSPPSGQHVAYRDAPPSYAESDASKTFRRRISSTEESSTLISSSDDGAIPRPSTDTSFSDDERRGRSGLTVEKRADGDESSTRPTAPSKDIARAQTDINTSVAGSRMDPEATAEATAGPAASRRGSNISRASLKSRPTSASAENRLSAGLSRLTQRMSGDKLSNMPEHAAPTDIPSAPPSIIETGEISDKSRTKKQPKDRSRLGLKEHHLLMKAKKPDRECILM